MAPSSILVVALAVLTASAGAQPLPGAFVFTESASAIAVVDPATEVVRRSAAIPPAEIAVADPDRRHLLLQRTFASTPPRHILRYDPVSDVVTSVQVSGPGFVSTVGSDEHFNPVLGMVANNVTWFVRKIGATYSTLSGIGASVYAFARDDDTGDWLCHASAPDRLLRWDGANATPVASAPTTFRILQDQHTGHFWRRLTADVQVVDRQGMVLQSFFGATGFDNDSVTGDAYLVRLVIPYTVIERRAAPAFTTVIRTWRIQRRYIPFGLLRWRMPTVRGRRPAVSGATFEIDIGLTRSPNARYVAALSLGGLRPGIATPAGTIPIVADALFLSTLGRDLPGFTSGFVGTVDAAGLASASVRIPAGVPTGTRFYFTAVAIDPTKPGGLDWGRTLATSVQ